MYSQRNEDDVILGLLGTPGVLLDIGANDGRTLSNSYLFTSRGWAGVLVEPCERSFHRLSELYRDRDDIQLLKYAIADFCGRTEFYESGEVLQKGDHSLLSTIDKGQLAQWKEGTFERTDVEVIDVARLMAISRYRAFDYITIDTEGCDFTIVRQLDLKALSCKVLCVEYCHDLASKQALVDYVRAQDFALFADTRINLIFRTLTA